MTATDGPDRLLDLIRAARVRDLWPDLPPPSEATLQRLIDACPRLPEGLAAIILGPRDGDPQPGDMWRAGRAEAVLVWVRRVFDDGVADVVPLVLDVEMADEESVLIPAGATPIQLELAAMLSCRTHIDFGAFINRICQLDIRREVDEVMAAVREGRHPRGVRVGLPIVDDHDRRIEYRCAIRDLLSELSPGGARRSSAAEHGRLGPWLAVQDVRDAGRPTGERVAAQLPGAGAAARVGAGVLVTLGRELERRVPALRLLGGDAQVGLHD